MTTNAYLGPIQTQTLILPESRAVLVERARKVKATELQAKIAAAVNARIATKTGK